MVIDHERRGRQSVVGQIVDADDTGLVFLTADIVWPVAHFIATWPRVSLARILVDDALLSGGTTRVGLPDDLFYFVDTDAIKLGDLRLRHAIAR